MNPIEDKQQIIDELRRPMAATDDFTPDVEAYVELPYGLRLVAQNKYVLRDSVRKLAEAIDPTCEIVYNESMSSEFGGPMVLCSTCGSGWPDPYFDEWSYCPYCGSRNIIEGQEDGEDG